VDVSAHAAVVEQQVEARLLEGRTIRWCIRLVTAGTLALLPFSGVSMLYAAVIAILAAGLEYPVTWTRQGGETQPPAGQAPGSLTIPRAATRIQR
jgi:hypothetical protein